MHSAQLVLMLLLRIGGRTVDFFQAWFFWDGGCCVFVERAPIAREVQLLVNIDILIPEDLRPQPFRGDCAGTES